jgi:hypothetical protein
MMSQDEHRLTIIFQRETDTDRTILTARRRLDCVSAHATAFLRCAHSDSGRT